MACEALQNLVRLKNVAKNSKKNPSHKRDIYGVSMFYIKLCMNQCWTSDNLL